MRKQANENGDESGFDKLVIHVRNHPESINELLEHSAFLPNLQRICRSISPDWTKADDLSSDVCLKLPSIIHQFDPLKGSFLTWLRRVTRNLFIDGLRRPSLATDDTPSDERYDLSDSEDSPFDQLWKRELEKELDDLIGKQEERTRLILTYYFEDLSFREIQETLKDEHGIRTTHVTIRNVVKRVLKEFFLSKVSFPRVDRKANKLSKRPVVKAKPDRKTESLGKRRVRNRRIALKK